jgi:Cytochrome c oxidase subunit IV
MNDSPRIPEATELVYVPEPSWRPLLVAAGLGLVLAGLFMGWAFAALGGVLFLFALRGWIRETRDELGRLPRHQRVTTAVLAAAPPRRRA